MATPMIKLQEATCNVLLASGTMAPRATIVTQNCTFYLGAQETRLAWPSCLVWFGPMDSSIMSQVRLELCVCGNQLAMQSHSLANCAKPVRGQEDA